MLVNDKERCVLYWIYLELIVHINDHLHPIYIVHAPKRLQIFFSDREA